MDEQTEFQDPLAQAYTESVDRERAAWQELQCVPSKPAVFALLLL